MVLLSTVERKAVPLLRVPFCCAPLSNRRGGVGQCGVLARDERLNKIFIFLAVTIPPPPQKKSIQHLLKFKSRLYLYCNLYSWLCLRNAIWRTWNKYWILGVNINVEDAIFFVDLIPY